MYLTHSESKQEIYKSLRLVLSVAFVGIFTNLIFRIDYVLLNTGSGELSLTEFTQLFALAVTIFSFSSLIKHNAGLKHASYLIVGFFIVLFIRELDFLFDYIIHGFWVYPALIVTCSALFLAYQGKDVIVNEMAFLLKKPSMKLILIGVALLLFFTRLYGMGDFWSNVMSDNYVGKVKTLSEEGSELLSYYLIALGSLTLRKKLMHKS